MSKAHEELVDWMVEHNTAITKGTLTPEQKKKYRELTMLAYAATMEEMESPIKKAFVQGKLFQTQHEETKA